MTERDNNDLDSDEESLDPSDEGRERPERVSRQSNSSVIQDEAGSNASDVDSTEHTGAKADVGPDVNSNTKGSNCTDTTGGESCQGSMCSTNFSSDKEVPGTRVPLQILIKALPPTTGRGALGCGANRPQDTVVCSTGGAIDGTAVVKSWTNSEVETERQRKSAATWYTNDADSRYQTQTPGGQNQSQRYRVSELPTRVLGKGSEKCA